MKHPGFCKQYKFNTMSHMHCKVLKKEKLKEEVVFIHLKGIYSSSANTTSGCQSTALDVHCAGFGRPRNIIGRKEIRLIVQTKLKLELARSFHF